MKTQQIVFTRINTAELIDVELSAPGPHQVAVKTVVSTVSAGTERANITGDPNVSATGAPSVSFPRTSGYNSAGGRVQLDDIVGETHRPESCGEVYERLVRNENFPVVVQFDWSDEV